MTVEDIISDIISFIAPTEPPFSSLFILGLSFVVSLSSALLSRYMIDVDKLERLTRETKAYSKLRMQMMKTADSKLKLKYERNADRMRKMQSELTMMNMKPLLIMMLPLMIFFAIFSSYYTFSIDANVNPVVISGHIPAVIPFNLPEQLIFPLGKNGYVEGWGNVFVPNYVWFYFGGSVAFSSIIRKVLRLQPDVQ
ncbi:MAG: EMC3/TMCO1 family protein [Candidatus Hodarchaeota archaeon]